MMMTARQFLPRRLPYAAMICHVSCKKARKSARGACKFIAMVQFDIVIIFAPPLEARVVVMVAGEEPPPGDVCASRGGVAVGRGVGGWQMSQKFLADLPGARCQHSCIASHSPHFSCECAL